jgi:hypothetical protein
MRRVAITLTWASLAFLVYVGIATYRLHPLMIDAGTTVPFVMLLGIAAAHYFEPAPRSAIWSGIALCVLWGLFGIATWLRTTVATRSPLNGDGYLSLFCLAVAVPGIVSLYRRRFERDSSRHAS